jgi:hypothetical protein
MIDRRKIRELADKLNIPKTTIAIVAGMAGSNISAFMGGGVMSSSAEDRIANAVRDIAKLLERFGTVRPDLSDAPRIKEMIKALKEETVFSVLLQTEPATEFFIGCGADGQIHTTNFFLRSRPLHLDTARVIAEDLRETGFPNAVVVENPYGGPDALPEIEKVGSIRESLEYRLAMGVT